MAVANLLKSGVEFLRPDITMSDVINSKIEQHMSIGSEEAFFVCDLGDVVQKFGVWSEMFPRVTPFYAMKCNDDAVLLEVLALLGTGFDCASKAEIEKVLAMGVDPAKIIYANPCKQSNYIKFAKSVGVDLMTFDNENELRKIKACFPDARLVLRILPPATKKVQCVLGNKFGCVARESDKLLKAAQELGLNLVGVSFHVGSGCYDPTAYRRAVEDARYVFDAAEKYGFKMSLLDIGGGFPGTVNARITIEEIAGELNPALDELFPADSGVDIISEPGRFFSASAYTLTANVIAKRVVEDETNDDNKSIMYYINDGVYGSFNCLLYDHADALAPCIPDKSKANAQQYNSSVWGPTCDGLDCIMKGVMLPELQEGDWVFFRDMGSYTVAAGSTFNGIPRPRVYYIAEVNLVGVADEGNAESSSEITAEDLFKLQMHSGHSVRSVIRKPLPLYTTVMPVQN